MGLDMFIYRATKPSVNDTEIYDRGAFELHIPEQEVGYSMYEEIAPYLQPVQMRSKYYDMEKIRADFGLSDEAYIGMSSYDGITVREPGSDNTVSISRWDIDEKYTKEEIETRYVCNLHEVHYWRKEYDVQNWFYDNLADVENCGFYIFGSDFIKDYNEAFPYDPIEVEEATEESALFYHEWY